MFLFLSYFCQTSKPMNTILLFIGALEVAECTPRIAIFISEKLQLVSEKIHSWT